MRIYSYFDRNLRPEAENHTFARQHCQLVNVFIVLNEDFDVIVELEGLIT